MWVLFPLGGVPNWAEYYFSPHQRPSHLIGRVSLLEVVGALHAPPLSRSIGPTFLPSYYTASNIPSFKISATLR